MEEEPLFALQRGRDWAGLGDREWSLWSGTLDRFVPEAVSALNVRRIAMTSRHLPSGPHAKPAGTRSWSKSAGEQDDQPPLLIFFMVPVNGCNFFRWQAQGSSLDARLHLRSFAFPPSICASSRKPSNSTVWPPPAGQG